MWELEIKKLITGFWAKFLLPFGWWHCEQGGGGRLLKCLLHAAPGRPGQLLRGHHPWVVAQQQKAGEVILILESSIFNLILRCHRRLALATMCLNSSETKPAKYNETFIDKYTLMDKRITIALLCLVIEMLSLLICAMQCARDTQENWISL